MFASIVVGGSPIELGQPYEVASPIIFSLPTSCPQSSTTTSPFPSETITPGAIILCYTQFAVHTSEYPTADSNFNLYLPVTWLGSSPVTAPSVLEMNAGGNLNMDNNALPPSWANPTINCNIVTGGLPSVVLQPGQESELTYLCNAHWTYAQAGLQLAANTAAKSVLLTLVSTTTPVDLSLISHFVSLSTYMAANVVFGVNYELSFAVGGYFQLFSVGVVMPQQKWTAFTWYLAAEVAQLAVDVMLGPISEVSLGACVASVGAAVGACVVGLVVIAVGVTAAEVSVYYLQEVADP
jgi:hypothetical protein